MLFFFFFKCISPAASLGCWGGKVVLQGWGANGLLEVGTWEQTQGLKPRW